MTDSRQTASMQERDWEHDHGNSVAAWTGVVLIMLGFLISSIGAFGSRLSVRRPLVSWRVSVSWV